MDRRAFIGAIGAALTGATVAVAQKPAKEVAQEPVPEAVQEPVPEVVQETPVRRQAPVARHRPEPPGEEKPVAFRIEATMRGA